MQTSVQMMVVVTALAIPTTQLIAQDNQSTAPGNAHAVTAGVAFASLCLMCRAPPTEMRDAC